MTRQAAPSTDTVTLIKLLFDTYDAMSRAVADALANLELSQSQAEMLWALEPSSSPVPMRELARRLRCDPSNVTLMTDRLVSLGLVERSPHPRDGRQRILTLTAEGVKVWQLLITRLEAQSPVFTALSAREQAQLTQLLTKTQATSPSG